MDKKSWKKWEGRFVWLTLRLALVFILTIIVGVNALYLKADTQTVTLIGVLAVNVGIAILASIVAMTICAWATEPSHGEF
jgi:membrane protein YdbS with pleckstrin-like domain